MTNLTTYYAVNLDGPSPYALVLKPDSISSQTYHGYLDTGELHQDMQDTFGPDVKQLPEAEFQAEIERRSVHTPEMLALLERHHEPGRDLTQYVVYGSYNRPMSSTWAKIEGAIFIQSDKSRTGYCTYVAVPEKLGDEIIARYELAFISHPAISEQVLSTKTVTLSISLTLETISDVLCSALEGGSNYWYNIEEYITPPTWELSSEPKRGNGFHWAQDYPLNPGGALMISDKDDYGQGTVNRLDLEAVQKGLAILGEKYPHHLADILAENADAGTGDALLQCSLFGDIIYG